MNKLHVNTLYEVSDTWQEFRNDTERICFAQVDGRQYVFISPLNSEFTSLLVDFEDYNEATKYFSKLFKAMKTEFHGAF